MKFSRSSRLFFSHLLALVMGAGLAFSGIPMSSSQAEPIINLPAGQGSGELIAQVSGAIEAGPQSFVATAVERTGPAVVRIDTERVVSRRLDPFFDDPFFRDFFGDRLRTLPREERVSGQGSGFIIDRSGIILTNAHVVSDADQVTVILKDGRSFEGEVRGTDEVTDLAVVKVNPAGANLPIAPLGDSSNLKVGDWAIAVGNPIGLNNTVTLGIISTLTRSSAQVGIPDKRIDFLQTDAAINPGNSGGPLLNARGEVIGINTAIRANAEGIGFAIPINKAKSLQTTLAAGQQVPHPYIGVQMITLTPEIARDNNQDPNSPIIVPEVDGVLVVRVLPNTPAERGGIRRGDVILSIDNTEVKSADQLQSLVENSGVGKVLRLKVLRGNRTLDLDIRAAQLSEMP